MLCQMGDDHLLHPVFFFRVKGSIQSRKTITTDLEALAVVFALQKFHFFVYGVRTIVRTGHRPLTCLFERRINISARILRGALEIQTYKLEIEYAAGCCGGRVSVVHYQRLQKKIVLRETVVICEVTEEGSEWLKDKRCDDDYRQLIEDTEAHQDHKDIKLPRCTKNIRRQTSSSKMATSNGGSL